MFDIGWPELLVIATVLIVVVGPKDLPGMLRTFGRMIAKLRGMAGEFRSQFDEALREAELDEVRKAVSDVQSLNPKTAMREAMEPFRKAGTDVKRTLDEDAVRGDDAEPFDSPIDLEDGPSQQRDALKPSDGVTVAKAEAESER